MRSRDDVDDHHTSSLFSKNLAGKPCKLSAMLNPLPASIPDEGLAGGAGIRAGLTDFGSRFDGESGRGRKDNSARPGRMFGLPASGLSGELLGTMPWMRALQGSMPSSTEQAELHCRAAVAAAAAAMSGGGVPPRPAAAASTLLGSGVGLPMLQNLLPNSLSQCSSLTNQSMRNDPIGVANHLGLHGLQPEPQLAASLAATLGAGLGDGIDSLDELASIDIPDELERDLFQGNLTNSVSTPTVLPTPSTDVALCGEGGPCAPSGGGKGEEGRIGGGGEDRVGFAPRIRSKPSRMEGLPMARSGCSGLLDTMSLDFSAPLSGKGCAASVAADDASMETVAFAEHEANGFPAAPSAKENPHLGSVLQRPTKAWCAEPGDMSCDADRYVQVITSGEDPFQIVWASEAWLQLCEYTMEQVLGHTLELIQGPLTTRTSLAQLMGAIREGRAISLSMVNHTRTGKAFSHALRVEPLRDSRGNVQCFQATSSNVEFLKSSLQSSMQVGCRARSARQPLDFVAPDQTALSELPELSNGVPETKTIQRIGSDLKISEMLDLFDAAHSRASAPSPALSALVGGHDEAVYE